MAFGFTPKHTETLDISQWTTEECVVLAQEVAQLKGWDIQWLSPHGMIAHTGTSAFSWGSELTLKLDEGHATIVSASTGSEMADFGKNKKVVLSFLDELQGLKGSYTPEQIAEKYAALQPGFPPPEEDLLTLPPPTTMDSVKGIFSLLVPREQYFVTPILVDINILVFIAMVVSGVHFIAPESMDLVTWGANFKPNTLGGEWWRLLTSCFVHIGIVHLLLNMFALVYIGMLLEPLLGRGLFLLGYLAAGIGGSITSLWWHDMTVSAGASGAIFGLYGLFLVLLTTKLIAPEARKDLLTSVAIFVGYNLLYGLKGGVDNAAHIGGLLTGALFGVFLLPELRKADEVLTRPWKGGLAATVVILGLTAFVFTRIPNDLVVLERTMEIFAANEEKALGVLQGPEDTDPAVLVQAIQEKGLPAWKENIQALRKLETLKLPPVLQDRNRLLLQYCELRLQSYERISRSIQENSRAYDSLLLDDNRQIEAVLKKLEQVGQEKSDR